MKIVYARDTFPNETSRSIFLAGPTPRSPDVRSWRPEAISMLQEIGFDGTVFVPEDSSAAPAFDYMHQVDWEEEGLRTADAILFWVPRELETMPGFTTNIEWGFWCNSGKVVLGAPHQAPKMAYLRYYAKKFRVPMAHTLRETVAATVNLIGEGQLRTGGEREVPLGIWKQPAFQQWYQAQVAAGNRLDGARVHWHFAPRNSTNPFCWVLQPRVRIPSEDRSKTGEFVISRPDISSVLAYHVGPTLRECSVVLVREFRSCAATSGFVHELPGGSSDTVCDPIETAASELAEETGMRFASDRFEFCGSRQCMATILTHRGSLFSMELTDHELAQFRSQEGQCFGVSDSERTNVEIRTVDEILHSSDVDWTHVGMILSVLTDVLN